MNKLQPNKIWIDAKFDAKFYAHAKYKEEWELIPYIRADKAVRLSAADMLALKPDNEAIIDDQWLVRFAINIELDVLERNGL